MALARKSDWDLNNLPPPGHEDIGPFVQSCFELARDDRFRLSLPQRWLQGYKLYRGKHWDQPHRDRMVINLFGANTDRTVANITAMEPSPEFALKDVQSIPDFVPPLPEGFNPGATFTDDAQSWWDETNCQDKLVSLILGSEIYGSNVVKMVFDATTKMPRMVPVSVWNWYPYPLKVEHPSDLPFAIHAYDVPTALARQKFADYIDKPEDIRPDDSFSLLGRERETYLPAISNTSTTMNAASGYGLEERTLLIECWIHDYNHPEDYPDGIRRITICNEGKTVLFDTANPNIQWNCDDAARERLKYSYGWGKFPFAFSNSHKDDNSNWGFSGSEQLAWLNFKIDETFSKISRYILRRINAIPVVPISSGVDPEDLSNDPGSIPCLQPESADESHGLGWFVPPAGADVDLYRYLELLLRVFDRTSQIEDADRGVNPPGITAGYAIRALQERGAVLMRSKIRAIDHLLKEIFRHWLSLYLNFGHVGKRITIAEDQVFVFRPFDFLGLEFDILIESGSTTAKSQVALEQQAVQLLGAGVVDKEYVLEVLKVPRYREILERMADKMSDQIVQAMAQAGYPVEGGMVEFNGQPLLMPPLMLIKQVLDLKTAGGSLSPMIATPGTPVGGGAPAQDNGAVPTDEIAAVAPEYAPPAQPSEAEP